MVHARQHLHARLVVLVGAGALLLSAANAHSQEIEADFTTTTQFNSGLSDTGVWNTGEGRLRADLVSNGVSLDFGGDGSDGAFNDGPAQTGITVVANTITFNTTTKSEFNFTSFDLTAPMTIQTTGSNPLVIRVQGAATIAGTVNLNGAQGNPNSNTIAAVAGGAAGSGGGQGGSAGFGTTNPGTPGQAGNPTVGTSRRGGSPGINIVDNYGDSRGGGGGCIGNNADANDAANAPFSGGSAGACSDTRTVVANSFTDAVFFGGAGGGGGGAFVDTFTPSNSVTGASGGGGGGALRLAATGAITISGTMTANGGTGGANDTDSAADPTTCGGAGGGGSGGSFWFQTLDSINVSGTVNVSAGAKGTSAAACSTSYDGGKGSIGVIRVDTPTGVVAGATVTKTISMPASLTVYSNAFSLPSGGVEFGVPTETIDTSSSGCGSDGSIAIDYEGSENGVTYTHSVPKTQISELSDFPFIRFKVSILPTGTAPPCLTALTIPYNPRDSVASSIELTDIEIKGGLFCGSIDGNQPKNAAGDVMLIALSSLVALLNGSFFKKRAHRSLQVRATRTIAS